jgi:transposase, IS5 family
MSQLTFVTTTGFERFRKLTRRELFLAEMQQVVPLADLCAVIEPV